MEIVKEKRVSNFQSGQILLITLLIMVVGLTISLAVIARSVTSIKISTQEEESQRAFYAAEAGLEEALLPGAALPAGEVSVGNASYIIKEVLGPPDQFAFPDLVKKDETQSVWLVKHNGDGTLCDPTGCTSPPSGDGRYPVGKPIDVCWDKPVGSSTVPAMEITIIHQRTIGSKEYGVARGVYDSEDLRRNSNKFWDVTSDIGSNCDSLTYKREIDFSTFNLPGYNYANPDNSTVRVVALRLRPLYNDAKVAVAVTSGYSATIPPQGNEIESLGKSGTAQRKLKVFRAYSSFPPIFDYVLFSGKPLSK